MYSKSEIDLFDKNIEKIKKQSTDHSNIVLNPTLKCRKDILSIFEKYIKENKLILYGGNAHNLAVKIKNKDDVIYKDDSELHDFDIYSYEPLTHICNICNLIYDAGYKNIRGIEAMHIETYSIKFDQYTFCDLSYMPKLIYNNINTLKIEKYRIIDPYISYIDFFRIFTDPLISSSFRWDKHFDRFNLLQKYYPFTTYELSKNTKINKLNNGFVINNKYKKIITEYLKNNNTLLLVGFNVYNKYVKITKANIDKLLLQYIEIISTDYINDTIKIIEYLKINTKDKIGIKEKYPFFQFRDYSTEIYVNDLLTLKIYDHNNLCIPFILINSIKYTSFHFNIMWFLIEKLYKMLYGDNCSTEVISKHFDYNEDYNKIISNMLQMKKNYLNINRLSFLDESIFKDFIIQCEGYFKSGPEIKNEQKKYNGFKYEPKKQNIKSREIFKTTIKKYQFKNITGRYINKTKNLKIKLD